MYRWIIFLFIVLLFQQAWVPGFFHDGYLYAALGKNALDGFWLVPKLNDLVYTEYFHHTPFVFILEGLFFKLFGVSFVSARIFAGLFTLGSLFVLLKWCRELKGDRFAIAVGIVFSLILPMIKKSRFPNLDTPLMFFTLTSLYYYFRALGDKRYWILSGLFFGLSLLTKGPMGFFIPIIMSVHILVTKRIRVLGSLYPWAGLILGLVIFGIWPLSLYISDKFIIFKNWFDFTFVHTISDGRGQASPVWTYVVFLLQGVNVWFLMALYSIRKKKDDFYWLAFIGFMSYLVLLSFSKFKYSHYLMPMYPFLAICAGYVLSELKIFEKVQSFYRGAVVLVTLILLIFPVTTEIRRDKELYQIKEVLELKGIKPKMWKNVDMVYPYWSLNNWASFHDMGLVKNVGSDFIVENDEIALVSNEVWEKRKSDFLDSVEIIKFKNLIVILDKENP